MISRLRAVQLVTLIVTLLSLSLPIGIGSNAYAKYPEKAKPKKITPKKYYKPKQTKGSYSRYKVKKRYVAPAPVEAKDIKISKTYSDKPTLVLLSRDNQGALSLSQLPEFKALVGGKVAGISSRNDFVFFSIEPKLQAFAEALIARTSTPHVALVAMQPSSGRILAIADKSTSIGSLSLHAGFPAASLFKLVTTAAALEQGSVKPLSLISFRGGNYTLNQWNYKPNSKTDRRYMSVMEALGKSVNPVFGRIALRHLNTETLRLYAQAFGFNSDLSSEVPLQISSASIPADDFGLSRTAAGFGEVHISPVHAAALMSGIANQGLIPRPSLIDRIVRSNGELLYQSQAKMVKRLSTAETSRALLQMMESTTTVGTSRKEFMRYNKPVLKGVPVAAKTGTLRGKNPAGLNNWFVAAAPINNPQIAVAVIVVDPQGISTKASHLGRLLIEQYISKP